MTSQSADRRRLPAELRQVFTNLIANAAEAAGPGGRSTSASCRKAHACERRPRKWQPGRSSSIADNGAGISDEVQPQLFQPFFTTKGERGTGLGLWVSRGIIDKHGGAIELSPATPATPPTAPRSRVFLADKPTTNATETSLPV